MEPHQNNIGQSTLISFEDAIILDSMSNDEYHKAIGISNSGIGLINKCPRLYEHEYIEGHREDGETKALHVGQAIHTIVLEPQKFFQRYIILPEGLNRTRKADKELYERALDDATKTNRKLLKYDEAQIVMGIRDSVERLEIWKRIRPEGKVENSIFWQHDNGVSLRCRPDWHNNFMSIDIKSTESVDPDDFRWSIRKYEYHRQGAMVLDGLAKVYKRPYKDHVILAIEKKPPYLCNLFLLDELDIAQGREDYFRGAEKYKQCVDNNHWPSYSDKITLISIPRRV